MFALLMERAFEVALASSPAVSAASRRRPAVDSSRTDEGGTPSRLVAVATATQHTAVERKER
jgi:hypothetical protein